MSQYIEKRNEKGFTLIELLIAIVVVGILAAVAIVGIAGLTNTGNKSACKQSQDAATAASAAFYANNLSDATRSATPWPTTVQEMTVASAASPTNTPPVYQAPAGATFTGAAMTVGTWTLTAGAGGANQTTFACS
jgi:type IV pilus assembly protein PilA